MSRNVYAVLFLLVVLVAAALYLGAGKYLTWPLLTSKPATNTGATGNGPAICTMEAKMCPDGSYVGRSGPKCEFSACPGSGGVQVKPKEISFTVSLNETSKTGAILTPLDVLEDSRCPTGVQCIWAGTVRVHVRLGSGAQAADKDFTLNAPVKLKNSTGGSDVVTLTAVTPAPRSTVKISPADYRFTFSVAKK